MRKAGQRWQIYDNLPNRFCLVFLVNGHRQPLKRLLFRRSPFLKSLYLLIMFSVSNKSRLSRLTSDLPHSLFQLNGFKIYSLDELHKIVNTVKVKGAKSKETG